MRGFCEEALILMPKEESIRGAGIGFKEKFVKQLELISDFIYSYGITLSALTCDDIAVKYKNKLNLSMYELLSFYDRRFAWKFCNYYREEDPINIHSIYRVAEKKVPVDVNKPIEEAVKDVSKRGNIAFLELEKTFKFIIDLQTKNNANFKIKIKEGDGKFILRRKNGLFFESYYNGVRINPYDFLGREKVIFFNDL